MVKELSRNKKSVLIITVTIALFILWFSWMSMVASKTNLMEDKIKAGLSVGIQAMERDAPRIKILNDGGYYIPDVNSNRPSVRYPGTARQEVYAVLLETLNQDASTPLCKVSSVGLDSTSEINAQATVRFDLLPGVSKTVVVRDSEPLPHYKNGTGNAEVN